MNNMPSQMVHTQNHLSGHNSPHLASTLIPGNISATRHGPTRRPTASWGSTAAGDDESGKVSSVSKPSAARK